MTQEEISKAFEGRWHMKTNGIIREHREQEPITYDILRKLCRDFFEAGIIIASSQPSTAVSEASPSESSFESWWNLYDKKRGREKCLQKWHKLTPVEQLACLRATPAYVSSTPDKAYRKDPLTYLNGKCWNDEIIVKNGTDKPTVEQQRISKLADILAG